MYLGIDMSVFAIPRILHDSDITCVANHTSTHFPIKHSPRQKEKRRGMVPAQTTEMTLTVALSFFLAAHPKP